MSVVDNLEQKLQEARVLLVGAGGIGCEVLKNLTLTGFRNIDAIDLDTIDVSNLNRQFLFNKTNVGQSKSKVAIDIAKTSYSRYSDGLNLNSLHKSIMLSEFDTDFFKSYSFVINALDNRAARSHVNRMCLSAQVPLLESGTEGYLGQTSFIKNALTACYECEGLQKDGKTYATCTIRNTPSKPIHCIVWAKHLFHQLFGEDDPDNDVSPEISKSVEKTSSNNGNSHNNNNKSEINDIIKTTQTTRDWAIKNNYNTIMLFNKLFNSDIDYLLSMENLWKERAKPSVLIYDEISDNIIDDDTNSAKNQATLDDQQVWSLKKCLDVFNESIKKLKDRMNEIGYLEWDKDDYWALKFVVSASNLRCKNFNLERKSLFDVKSLAGNIVPAISSTNSIIGGLLVLQAIRLLEKMPRHEEYRAMEDSERNELLKGVGRLTYLKKTALNNQTLIASYESFEPQPNCLACSKGKIQEAKVYLSVEDNTFADFIDKIVKDTFHFVSPDITLTDGSGTIIWSQEDSDENDQVLKKRKLSEIPHISPVKTRLLISDLLQDKELFMVLINEKVDEEVHKEFFYIKLE